MVPEELVRLVRVTNLEARTSVRPKYEKKEEFSIKAGLHQGSGLSPFLFTVILEVIRKEFRGRLPW